MANLATQATAEADRARPLPATSCTCHTATCCCCRCCWCCCCCCYILNALQLQHQPESHFHFSMLISEKSWKKCEKKQNETKRKFYEGAFDVFEIVLLRAFLGALTRARFMNYHIIFMAATFENRRSLSFNLFLLLLLLLLLVE